MMHRLEEARQRSSAKQPYLDVATLLPQIDEKYRFLLIARRSTSKNASLVEEETAIN